MFSGIQKEKKYFIININSSQISGALIYFDADLQVPIIGYSVHEYIKVKKNDLAETFRMNTKESIEKVMMRLSNYVNISGGGESVEKLFVFLSPPWVRKNIHSIVDERIGPFTVTEKYLEKFLENGGQIRETEYLLKAQVISIKANGYNVLISDLINKKLTKLDISLMDSYIDEQDKEMIEKVLEETYPSLDIAYSAFLPVFFSQIKKLYDISDDFIFMDFTGEVMELGIYQDGQIKNMTSLQIGKNKILREMVDTKVSTSISEAEYTFNLFMQSNLDTDLEKKVRALMKKNITEMTEEVKKDLKSHKNLHIPKKAFIVSRGEMNYLLKDFSLGEETYFVGKTLINNFVQAKEDKYFDNFLALEAEYIFE